MATIEDIAKIADMSNDSRKKLIIHLMREHNLSKKEAEEVIQEAYSMMDTYHSNPRSMAEIMTKTRIYLGIPHDCPDPKHGKLITHIWNTCKAESEEPKRLYGSLAKELAIAKQCVTLIEKTNYSIPTFQY